METWYILVAIVLFAGYLIFDAYRLYKKRKEDEQAVRDAEEFLALMAQKEENQTPKFSTIDVTEKEVVVAEVHEDTEFFDIAKQDPKAPLEQNNTAEVTTAKKQSKKPRKPRVTKSKKTK